MTKSRWNSFSFSTLKKKKSMCAFEYHLFCWKLKTIKKKSLFMLESIMHLPICTGYISWTVQELLDLKKEKREKKGKKRKREKT